MTDLKEGFYWAKLRLADNPDDNSSTWEVCFVFENISPPWCEADIESGECFMVSVPGLTPAQRVDAFEWGPAVVRPTELVDD
jgi:hypothetical protein